MKNIFIGIDFSKEKFDATVIQAEGLQEKCERQWNTFKSTPAGFRSFVSWVKKSSGTEYDTDQWLFCGENTGDYSIRLCDYLYGKGYDMWLANAKSVKNSDILKRYKTDKADSAMIAEYAMRYNDKAVLYETPTATFSDLRQLFLYRHQLVKQRASLKTRKGEKRYCLGKSEAKNFMDRSSKHLILEFTKEIDKIEKKILELIKSDEALSSTYEIITSMPGMGFVNATCLIVFTNNYKKFNYDARKIGCYYGVAPFGKDSGKSIHTPPHVNYMANKLIKSYLSQAALAAINFCEPIARYYQRLLSRGKKVQVALNNVKNKLLHIITAMVRNGTRFQPDYAYAKAVMEELNTIC